MGRADELWDRIWQAHLGHFVELYQPAGTRQKVSRNELGARVVLADGRLDRFFSNLPTLDLLDARASATAWGCALGCR